MPLREHIAELRRRVIISAIAVILGSIAGWFLYQPVMSGLIVDPVLQQARAHHLPIRFVYTSIADSFTIKVRVAGYLGMIIASPVWLYQVWAFITPGLTRKERRYSLVFVAAAVPLFLAGVALAITIFPKAMVFGADFALPGSENLPPVATVVTFATRLIIALGAAFLLPLFLVALNLAGLLSGRTLGSHWRISVFVSFLFAAVVSPSPDPTPMIVMALPLVLLYVISVGICLLNDRRRARRELAGWGRLDDDEASRLDDLTDEESSGPVTASGPVERPGPIDPGHDDAT